MLSPVLNDWLETDDMAAFTVSAKPMNPAASSRRSEFVFIGIRNTNYDLVINSYNQKKIYRIPWFPHQGFTLKMNQGYPYDHLHSELFFSRGMAESTVSHRRDSSRSLALRNRRQQLHRATNRPRSGSAHRFRRFADRKSRVEIASPPVIIGYERLFPTWARIF